MAEHRIILGGAQYLPFARSRLRVLRAMGREYAVERHRLPDAEVTIRIVGEHEYIVLLGGVRRGFVLLPQWADAAQVQTDLAECTLLRHPGATWEKWVRPYLPGRDDYVPYVVRSTRAGTRQAGEFDWLDVHALWDGKVFKNGLNFMLAPGVTSGELLPAVFEDERLLLLVGDLGVSHSESAGPTSLYTFLDFFDPTSDDEPFLAGVRFNAAAAKAQILGLAQTDAGALQVWRASVQLSATAPYFTATETEGQMNVASGMFTSGGWTSNTTGPVNGPILGGVANATSMASFHVYTGSDPAARSYSHPFLGAGYSASGGSTVNTATHVKTVEAEDTVTLYDGVTCTVARTISTNTSYFAQDALFYGTAPTSYYAVYGAGDLPPDGATVVIPASFGTATLIPAGTPITSSPVYRENAAETRTHTDESSATITVSDMALPLYSASISHSMTGSRGSKADELYTAPGSGSINTGGKPSWDCLIAATKSTGAFVDQSRDTNIHAVSITVRDMVYADTANEVYVYLQTTISSAETQLAGLDGSSTTGSSTVTITLVLSGPGVSESVAVASFSYDEAATITLVDPVDINMGTSQLNWYYHVPPRIEPIFAPLWQEQGLCPHIAYTVAGEVGAGDPPVQARVLASFRLQFCKTTRLIEDGDPPTLDAVQQFFPYMLEQTLNAYALPTAEIFAELESQAAVLEVSLPADSVYDGVGVTGASRHGHFYRT
jgi:hypothetical protein